MLAVLFTVLTMLAFATGLPAPVQKNETNCVVMTAERHKQIKLAEKQISELLLNIEKQIGDIVISDVTVKINKYSDEEAKKPINLMVLVNDCDYLADNVTSGPVVTYFDEYNGTAVEVTKNSLEDNNSVKLKGTSGKSDTKVEQEESNSAKYKVTSGKSKNTSEKSTITSEKFKKTSKKSKETSEKSKNTSHKSKNTSEKSKNTFEKSKNTSHKSKNTSEKSKNTSEKSKNTSEKSKNTFETTVDATEKSKVTSEKFNCKVKDTNSEEENDATVIGDTNDDDCDTNDDDCDTNDQVTDTKVITLSSATCLEERILQLSKEELKWVKRLQRAKGNRAFLLIIHETGVREIKFF